MIVLGQKTGKYGRTLIALILSPILESTRYCGALDTLQYKKGQGIWER